MKTENSNFVEFVQLENIIRKKISSDVLFELISSNYPYATIKTTYPSAFLVKSREHRIPVISQIESETGWILKIQKETKPVDFVIDELLILFPNIHSITKPRIKTYKPDDRKKRIDRLFFAYCKLSEPVWADIDDFQKKIKILNKKTGYTVHLLLNLNDAEMVIKDLFPQSVELSNLHFENDTVQVKYENHDPQPGCLSGIAEKVNQTTGYQATFKCLPISKKALEDYLFKRLDNDVFFEILEYSGNEVVISIPRFIWLIGPSGAYKQEILEETGWVVVGVEHPISQENLDLTIKKAIGHEIGFNHSDCFLRDTDSRQGSEALLYCDHPDLVNSSDEYKNIANKLMVKVGWKLTFLLEFEAAKSYIEKIISPHAKVTEIRLSDLKNIEILCIDPSLVLSNDLENIELSTGYTIKVLKAFNLNPYDNELNRRSHYALETSSKKVWKNCPMCGGKGKIERSRE